MNMAKGVRLSPDPALVFLVGVLVVVSIPLALLVALPAPAPPPHLNEWSAESYYNWPIGPGIRNAFGYGPIYLSAVTRSVYISGSADVLNWSTPNGTGNSSGSCATTPVLCAVYVGVFFPVGWRSFVNSTLNNSTPTPPIWCLSGENGSCTSRSAASFTSTDLNSTGQGWELVVWTTMGIVLAANLQLDILYAP